MTGFGKEREPQVGGTKQTAQCRVVGGAGGYLASLAAEKDKGPHLFRLLYCDLSDHTGTWTRAQPLIKLRYHFLSPRGACDRKPAKFVQLHFGRLVSFTKYYTSPQNRLGNEAELIFIY